MKHTDLAIYLRAHYPLLYVVSHEERRVLRVLEELATEHQFALHVWSYTEGLYNTALPKERNLDVREPIAMLDRIIEQARGERGPGARTVFVLRDFHPFIAQDPAVIRRLREAADYAHQAPAPIFSIVILSPVLQIPPELTKAVTVVDFPLPGETELATRIDGIGQKLSKRGAGHDLDHRARERIVRASLGLTMTEAEQAIAKALILQGRLNDRAVDVVNDEKRQIVRKSEVLEYYEPREDLAGVGGLDNLKAWLADRQNALTSEAREFGLPMPKGLLLVGAPGCGKSLTAKAIGATWKMPVLRLDMGRVFSGIVGSSEANVRQVQKIAEAMAPCILWTDEIEKGFSGVASSNVSDAGTTARVFGSMLTWMQEKEAPVFVVATANDIDQLPPPLVRRFDETFFVDLPQQAAREEILTIQLRRVKRDPAQFDRAAAAAAMDGFSGAEIERAVTDALFVAFNDGARVVTTDDLIAAARATVPVAKTMGAKIQALRDWAKKSNVRRASRDDTAPALDLANLASPIDAIAVDLFADDDGHA